MGQILPSRWGPGNVWVSQKLPFATGPEGGVFAIVEENAAAEKINASYAVRILRLTLLAPDIVEAILDGHQPTETTLAVVIGPFVVGWGEQGIPAGRTDKKAKFETGVN